MHEVARLVADGDSPAGKSKPGRAKIVEWVERFAKPIAVVQNRMGIAEFINGRAFARPVGSTYPARYALASSGWIVA
jgi:hypothetical protein